MHSLAWFLYFVIPSSRLVPSSLTHCLLCPAPISIVAGTPIPCCMWKLNKRVSAYWRYSSALIKMTSLTWLKNNSAWFLSDPEGVLLSQVRVWNSCWADQGACFNKGFILTASTHIMLFVEFKSFRFIWSAKRRVQCCFCPCCFIILANFQPFFLFRTDVLIF